MPKQKITFASGLYDRFLPLYTKEVKPDGIDLDFTVIDDPREIFDRMGGDLVFDACEMSGQNTSVKQHRALIGVARRCLKSPFGTKQTFGTPVDHDRYHFEIGHQSVRFAP